mgnify:CR=1 FL=1
MSARLMRRASVGRVLASKEPAFALRSIREAPGALASTRRRVAATAAINPLRTPASLRAGAAHRAAAPLLSPYRSTAAAQARVPPQNRFKHATSGMAHELLRAGTAPLRRPLNLRGVT